MNANRYLELQRHNPKTSEILGSMAFNGKNFLDEQSRLWPYKFSYYGNNYPLFVPTIINSFNQFDTGFSVTPILGSDDHYMTDWAIAVKLPDGTGKIAPVRWLKEGIKQPVIDPLTQKYFWLENSDQLCSYINKAFEDMLGANQVYFVKSEDRWTLLVNESSTIVSIYFNDRMKMFFGFNYGLRNRIDIIKLQSTVLSDTNYWRIETPSSNNKLFPFSKIIFKSQELNVMPLTIVDISHELAEYGSSTILSFDLNVSDISELGTSISFTSENKDRCLSLQTEGLPSSFSVQAYFVTKNGALLPVMLGEGETISISMMFF